MENLSDLELIKNIKNQEDIDFSLKELINRHSGIYINIVNGYMKNCPFSSLKNDIINDKDITIYNSALKYNETRGAKFSTFLGNETKWKCLNTSNKNNKNNKTIEINENKVSLLKDKTFQESAQNQQQEQEILEYFFESLKNQTDKRIEKIFKLRYEGHKKLTPWRKVSKKMNLSIQGCINIHNSALKRISKTLKYRYENDS